MYYNPGPMFKLNDRGFSISPVKHPTTGKMKGHMGQDYSRAAGVESVRGEPVPVAEDGIVVFSGLGSGFGNVVVVAHKDSVGNYAGLTVYAHLNKPSELKAGEFIQKGASVGPCGDSGGVSSGAHIHFEVHLLPQRHSEEKLLDILENNGRYYYGSVVAAKIYATNPVAFNGFETLSEGKRISSTFSPFEFLANAISSDAQAGELDDWLAKKEAASVVSGQQDPLIIDLNNDGLMTSSIEAGTYFDFNGDGFAEWAGWVQSGDALLALDINHNGVVDSGQELFGDQSTLPSGARAANGYEALAALDNGDGVIDASDATYADLRVWVDNGDGISDAAELVSLADAGIKSIDLSHVASGLQDNSGNTLAQSNPHGVQMSDGSTRQSGSFLLNGNSEDTISLQEIDLTPALRSLPYLPGSGTVHDLGQAMARDSTLEQMTTSLVSASNLEGFGARFDDLLFRWAGAADIPPTSEGSFIDARHLAVLNAFSGQRFVGVEGSHPNSAAGALLEEAYQDLKLQYMSLFLMQGQLKPLWDNAAIIYHEDAPATVSYDAVVPIILALDQSVESVRTAWYFFQSVKYLKLSETQPFESMLAKIDGSFYGAVGRFIASQPVMSDGQLRVGGGAVVGGGSPDMLFGGGGVDALQGYGGSDFLDGGAGDDTLDGGAGDDVLRGDAGDDRLTDSEGANVFFGGAGNDVMGPLTTTAFWGPNTYIGGLGDDISVGSRGADTYVFEFGGGADIIRENYFNSGGDVINIGPGSLPADWSASRVGTNLVLVHSTGTDKITVERWFESSDSKSYRVDRVTFADGTVWSAAELTERGLTLYGTATADNLQGFNAYDDVIFSSGGNDTVSGYAGNDKLYGDQGDDKLYGGDGNDILYGGDGADTLEGQAGGDYLDGGTGNDRLTDTSGLDTFDGGDGEDIMGSTTTTQIQGPNTYIGGRGNDTSYGSRGGDIYVFNLGDGQDIIRENMYNAGGDVVRFGQGIQATDWTGSRVGTSLVLTDSRGLDKLTFEQWFGSTDMKAYRVDRVEFSDGTVWTNAELSERALTVFGTSAVDNLKGLDSTNDIIHGLVGNDTISGYAGDDKLHGDEGDDTLYGGDGVDSLYGGDGADYLDGQAGNDYLSGGGGADRLYDTSGANTFDGGDGNDMLMSASTTAFVGPNTYIGGQGNDTIFGSRGGDTYIFGLGDGQDIVRENPYGSGTDVVQFSPGLSAADFAASRSGTSLVLSHANGLDKLTFENWFYTTSGTEYQVERFEFADSTVLSGSDVAALVGAPSLYPMLSASMFTM